MIPLSMEIFVFTKNKQQSKLKLSLSFLICQMCQIQEDCGLFLLLISVPNGIICNDHFANYYVLNKMWKQTKNKLLIMKLENLKQSSTGMHSQVTYLDIWVESSQVSTMHCIAILHKTKLHQKFYQRDLTFIFFFYISVLNPLK